MSTRCTPFGLFAGCNLGEFGDATEIHIKAKEGKRLTRFDMNFLVLFSKRLEQDVTVKKQLQWYPNSTLYKIGNHYRYIEYIFKKSKKRIYSIEEVQYNEFIALLLDAAYQGKNIDQLAELLIREDIDKEEALDFIEILIENQLLISELEPTLTGEDYFTQLKERLKKYKNVAFWIDWIESCERKLTQIDQTIGNDVDIYESLNEKVDSLKISIDKKYLYQTDFYSEVKNNQLNKRIGYKILKIMPLLNKMTSSSSNERLTSFKNAFSKRYETREMPLTTVLDTEIGIGYLQEQKATDSTPFLEEFESHIHTQKNAGQRFFQNEIAQILDSKLTAIKKSGETYLELEDKDFEMLTVNWRDLPDTFSSIVELLNINSEKPTIVLSHVSGASAANLLGRFTTGDQELNEYVAKIVATENAMQPAKIKAEIVHLPEARTGNILRRNVSRGYEIPYLAKTNDQEKQLDIDDLFISVKRGNIVLRSKKLNKEVVPYLSNAHNYSANSLPIYHFLCDLQKDNKRIGIGFSWSSLHEKEAFLPRVIYKDVIIQRARWKISTEDIEQLNAAVGNGAVIKEWRLKRKIPKRVQLREGDNTLVIDFDNKTAIEVLLSIVKKRKKGILEEFLFGQGDAESNTIGEEDYTNQVVLSFYNKEKLLNTRTN